MSYEEELASHTTGQEHSPGFAFAKEITMLREARIISQDTLRPDHLALAMLDALGTFDQRAADEMREDAPPEPATLSLDHDAWRAWDEYRERVQDELDNTALGEGWTVELDEGDGALFRLRPMYTPKELASELLDYLEHRTAENGEPYVDLIPATTGHEELDDLWGAMADDHDWRMASLAAYEVLDEARRGIEPAVIEERSYEYAEAPAHDYELLRWYQGGRQRANAVMDAWEDMDNVSRGDIEGDPVPTLLARGYIWQMSRLVEQAARALDEAAEEFNQ